MFSPSRCTLDRNSPLFYPYVNIRSPNLLQGFEDTSDMIKVLFVGDGDLKSTLETTSKEGIQNLCVHLNNPDPSVHARNVIMLKILSSSNFNPENQEDLGFLWDIWYNTKWPESSRKRFIKVLKDLLEDKLPDQLKFGASSNFSKLKEILSSWLSISLKNQSQSEFLIKNILKERPSLLFDSLQKYRDSSHLGKPFDAVFSDTVDKCCAEWERNIGTKDLPAPIRAKIREEMRQFIMTGSCRIGNEKYVCANPTFLHPTTHHWISESSLPFDGYVPLLFNEKLNPSAKDGMLIEFCQEKLKRLLLAYREKMENTEIVFSFEDIFEFCYSGKTEKFDVIDCSTLADQAGLANLLNACSERLSNSPRALLYTQTMYWVGQSISVKQYVEDALCCPLSMTPTIYGLRLEDHVELGTYSPVGFRSPYSHLAVLCWKKVPSFSNLSLSQSPALKNSLQQLANRCFSIKGPAINAAKMRDFTWLHFTPHTFSLIMDSIFERIVAKDFMDSLDISHHFDLSRHTMDALKNGQKILKYSTDKFRTYLETEYLSTLEYIYMVMGRSGPRMLRLVLSPSHGQIKSCLAQNLAKKLPLSPTNFQDSISGSGVHFIDNFQLDVTKTFVGEIETIKLSFILPEKHGLKMPYLGIVLDLDSLSPILVFESFQTLNVEEFHFPYPFRSKTSSLQSNTSPRIWHMKVDRCVELEDCYSLRISTNCPNSEGTNISVKNEKPCESSHNVTVSVLKPINIQPLELSFPHPILAHQIKLTRSVRFIDVVFKKALFEPWPCEFQSKHLKWDLKCLKSWEEGIGLDSLEDHVKSQLMTHSNLSQLPMLTRVRMLIRDIFFKSNTRKSDLFVVINGKESSVDKDPESYWALRVHQPILTSPLGSPLLAVSAFDIQLGKHLGFKEDFIRIFNAEATEENSILCSLTSEELTVVRFILRLNSTKILPTAWQQKNLPFDGSMSFLATFISPLYLDLPTSKEELDEIGEKLGIAKTSRFTSNEVVIDDNSYCILCKKVSLTLKRCSACRSVIYCGVECQRKHWIQHKIYCKVLKSALFTKP